MAFDPFRWSPSGIYIAKTAALTVYKLTTVNAITTRFLQAEPPKNERSGINGEFTFGGYPMTRSGQPSRPPGDKLSHLPGLAEQQH